MQRRRSIRARVLEGGNGELHDGVGVTGAEDFGEVFEGAIPGTAESVPEAAILLGWARELGMPIGEAADSKPVSAGTRQATVDDVLRMLGIKGFAMTQGAADALLSTAAHVQALLDGLLVDGLVASVAGAYRLTEPGTARASELVAKEAAAWGSERANAALTSCDTSVLFGSVVSACRFCLVSFAGLLARPSTKRSS